jgi:hypothetical protein
LDYFSQSSGSELSVAIQQCDFNNYVHKEPGQAALIVANSKQNRLSITDSNFLRNDMTFNNSKVRSCDVVDVLSIDTVVSLPLSFLAWSGTLQCSMIVLVP